MKKDLFVNKDSESYKVVKDAAENGNIISTENMTDEEFLAMFKNREMETSEKPTYEELEKINAELISVVNDSRLVRCGKECYAADEDPNCILEGQFQEEIRKLSELKNDLEKFLDSFGLGWRDLYPDDMIGAIRNLIEDKGDSNGS